MQMTDPRALEIVLKLSRSRKYGHLFEPTLERIAQWAIERHPSQRAAEKAAKRKLHQAHGAYIRPGQTARVEKIIESLPTDPTLDELKLACMEVLKCHTSTRERLDYIEKLYRDIEQAIGRPRSVLDLASGLNAFTLPWMALAPGASYHCVDIDCRLMALANRVLRRLPGDNIATCGDILVSIPADRVDMVLLLKSLTCLERQQSGAGGRVLRGLRANHVVVSFPTCSLGGRNRGMAVRYDGILSELVADLGWETTALRYANETVYLLTTPLAFMS